jgi:hypothetical protein
MAGSVLRFRARDGSASIGRAQSDESAQDGLFPVDRFPADLILVESRGDRDLQAFPVSASA